MSNRDDAFEAVGVELLRQGIKAVVESLEYYASDEHTDDYSSLEILHNNMPKQNKAIRDFIKGDRPVPKGQQEALDELDELISEMSDEYMEINPSNYNDDDVNDLNNAMISMGNIEDALKKVAIKLRNHIKGE